MVQNVGYKSLLKQRARQEGWGFLSAGMNFSEKMSFFAEATKDSSALAHSPVSPGGNAKKF